MSSEMCKRCIHHTVCMRDKNIISDVFVAGHPDYFDNKKLFERFIERKKAGFPCDTFCGWIPCSERLPERIIDDDVETVQEFFVTVKERWPGEEWKYHTDIAEYPGDYIDDVWQTYNDWREGQEVHVIAWMPLPESYKGE